MKKNILKLLSVFTLIVGFASCQDDETDFVSGTQPIITATTTSYTVNEGDVVSVTLTSNIASSRSMIVKLDVVSGTAVDQEDFVINAPTTSINNGWGDDGYIVTFPANTTSYTFTISTLADEELEDAENVRIRMSTTATMIGQIAPSSEFIDITINNVASNTLNLTFDWDKSFNSGGSNFSLCEIEYDVDILVFDENFNDLDITDAQTGDCPEHLSMSLADYPDGTYYIVGYLYENQGLSNSGLPVFDIPMNISYSRGGSTTLNEENTFSSPFMTSNSQNDDFEIVAAIVVENGVFTIKNASNVTIASGKQSSIKNSFKSKSKLKK